MGRNLLEALKKSSNQLSIFQARLIYGAAITLIITTVVTSIILNQNGTLSKSLGHGMTGRTVLGLTGGIGTGLGSLLAAMVYICRQNTPKSKNAKYEVQKKETGDGDVYRLISTNTDAYIEWQVIKSQDLGKYFWCNARIGAEMHFLLNKSEFFLCVEQTFIGIYYKDNQCTFDTKRMKGYHFPHLHALEEWDQEGKLNTVFQDLITQVEEQQGIKFSSQVVPYRNIELCMVSDAARREGAQILLEVAQKKELPQEVASPQTDSSSTFTMKRVYLKGDPIAPRSGAL